MSQSKTPNSTQNVHALRNLEDVKRIATGGMSEIYRARQKSLERYLVIKRLKEDLRAQSDLRERFRREAKALASVLHQNVAHVYDFVETESESYLLMEYIDGVDVSVAIEKMGNLPPDVAACILLGMAKGVQHLHAHNLIHRDLKPANIRLSSRGAVKIMDFGIVLELENTSLTRPGTMVGSPSYLSPEQVLGDPITPKSDIFLLGICFYEMLTGSKPFREERGESVFARIRSGVYVPVREAIPSVPKPLSDLVDWCLRREPEERLGSARELIFELEKWLGPEKSSRSEEFLIRFLDREALANVSVPALQAVAPKSFSLWRKALLPVLLVAGLTFVFLSGFWLGQQVPSMTPATQYPAPITKGAIPPKRPIRPIH